MFKPFEEVERTPGHAPVDPRTFCDRDSMMEDPPGYVGRAVERDMACINTPGEAPADPHVVGDDVAFDVATSADDQTVGSDLPVNVAVDMNDPRRLQPALDGESLAEMRRGIFGAVATERHLRQRKLRQRGHANTNPRSNRPPLAPVPR